jgi:hypothetical protein
MTIRFGPCCFCGEPIEATATDPCEVKVSTSAAGKTWQVWFCHGQCFRDRLAVLPDNEGFFDPAHF